MLYMLVVCGGHLCMPVESVGRYNLTQADCEARVMQMRATGTDVHCYPSWRDEVWRDFIMPREPEHAIVIVH